MKKRAAYFLLLSEYFGRPFDDGIYRALLEAGYEIDVFSPDAGVQDIYPSEVRRRDVTYRARWLADSLARGSWRSYDLFLGTSDIPMAFAGVLAAAAGKPSVVVCDEIYLGGYEGAATRYWKSLTRWAMRRADLTVITDGARIPLQRTYAGLETAHPFVELPCCYAFDPHRYDRKASRHALGITDSEYIVSFAGRPSAGTGLDWALAATTLLGGARLLVQTAGPVDPVTDALFRAVEAGGRVIYRPERLSYRDSLAITAAADVAVVGYTSPKPQFQTMGVSSNKLCLSLWLGIPVVATRQPSFSFIEQYGCGILIEREDELPEALARVREDHHVFSTNARRAVEGWIRAEPRRQRVAGLLARL